MSAYPIRGTVSFPTPCAGCGQTIHPWDRIRYTYDGPRGRSRPWCNTCRPLPEQKAPQ